MDLLDKHGNEHDETTHGNWARKPVRTGRREGTVLFQRTEFLTQVIARRQGGGRLGQIASRRERLLMANDVETFMEMFGPDWLGALTAHRRGDLSEFVTKRDNRLLVDDAWNERIDFYSELLTKRGKTRFERLLERSGGEGEIRERQVADIFKTAFDQGGRSASIVTDHVIEFDPNHPRVVTWAEDNAAELIKDLNTESRDVVKVMIREGIHDGTSEEILKGRIANVVGLDERRRRAVARFEVEQTRQGVPPGRVDRLAKAYARRLREQRAESIVRTEIQKAVEAGKLEFWKQAADSGLITRGESWRSWVVHDDERLCPYCRPVDGKRARLGGQFFTPLGKVDGPPLHINCRCWTELEAPLHILEPIIKHPHHKSSQTEHGNWARGGAKRTTGAPDYIPLEDAGKTRRQKVDDVLAERKVKKPSKARLKPGSTAARRRTNKKLLAAHLDRWDRMINRRGKGVGLRSESIWRVGSNERLRANLKRDMGEVVRALDRYKVGGSTPADVKRFQGQIESAMKGRKEPPGPDAGRTPGDVGRTSSIAGHRRSLARIRAASKERRERAKRVAAAKRRADDK